MGDVLDRYDAAPRLARRYVWDGLSFWEALEEASRLDPASGVQRFMSSALYQLEKALTAEREAYDREIESRLARERERQSPLI